MASNECRSSRKKVRHVSSRYMQAAEKISSNSRENTTFFKGSRENLNLTRSYDSASCIKDNISIEGSKMTSTPFLKGTCPVPSFDSSVVIKKSKSVPNVKEEIGPLTSLSLHPRSTRKNLNDTLFPSGPIVASRKPVKKDFFDEKSAELDINLHYAEYLHTKFLELESEKTLEKRCACALEKCHKVFCLMMTNLDTLKKQLSQIEEASAFLKTVEHCKKQVNIFTPLFDIIEPLEKQYQSIAEAVNIAKHKLQIKDIILPEPGSEGEVIQLLQSFNETISSFFNHFKNAEDISLSATNLENYLSLAGQISDALKEGFELVSKAQDLAITEAAFKFGSESTV